MKSEFKQIATLTLALVLVLGLISVDNISGVFARELTEESISVGMDELSDSLESENLSELSESEELVSMGRTVTEPETEAEEESVGVVLRLPAGEGYRLYEDSGCKTELIGAVMLDESRNTVYVCATESYSIVRAAVTNTEGELVAADIVAKGARLWQVTVPVEQSGELVLNVVTAADTRDNETTQPTVPEEPEQTQESGASNETGKTETPSGGDNTGTNMGEIVPEQEGILVATDAQVTVKAIAGERYIDFEGAKSVSISRDSAFTVSYTVSGYVPAVYAAQELRFGSAIPAGTRVLLKTAGGYWGYVAAEDTTVVSLGQFGRLGGTEAFALNTTVETAVQPFTEQFVVDFSRATTKPKEDKLSVSLALVPGAAQQMIPEPMKEVVRTQTIALKDVAQFDFKVLSVQDRTAVLKLDYTAPQDNAVASIWKGRTAALVMSVNQKTTYLPSDLTLTVKRGEGKNATEMTYSMVNGQFIVPLAEVQDESLTVTINSALFMSDNIIFDTAWYVSASDAGISPLNGYFAGGKTISFSGKRSEELAARVVSEQRLVTGDGVLVVAVAYRAVPEGATLSAELRRRNDEGEFVRVKKTKQEIKKQGNYEFSLKGQLSGSYCVMVVVNDAEGALLLEVPYYFSYLKE